MTRQATSVEIGETLAASRAMRRMNPSAKGARRHALLTLATLPWWAPALDALAQTALPALPPLDERARGIKVERGGLSLDIPTIAETGASVPIVLFATWRVRVLAA